MDLHDTCDEVVGFVRAWSAKTEISADRFIRWVGVARGKFFDWKKRRQGQRAHALVPRDHWIEQEEREKVIPYHGQHPLEGYRRLTFTMLDVVAVSPATSYRVLRGAGRLDRWKQKPSKKSFKEFIRIAGMTHVRTAYHPRSNGKVERWHKTVKSEAILITRRPRSKRPARSSRASWRNTTPCACTAPSATSRRTTSSPSAATRSTPR